jgi:ribulose-5-phosphate 4-epimerase/fuculose-1-phosphate aldolase
LLSLDNAIDQLAEAGRYMFANELAWGNAGNLSARTGEGHYVITASGTHLGSLGAGDFVECALDGSAITTGRGRPSKETPMHAAVYSARPEVGAVLHASPFYSTMTACADVDIPNDLFVEDMYYLERVAHVRYEHPGSAGLGQAVAEAVGEANVLLLDHHGVLVYDVSVREALAALHTLELVCRMVVEARQAGITLRSLPAATVADFLDRSGYRPRRSWQ